MTLEIPQRHARTFLGETFTFSSWNDIKPLYENLANRSIENKQDLWKWFLDRSELESYLSENFAWRYINMTCDTASEEYQKSYQFFVEDIQPQLAEYENELDKKALESPFLSQIQEKGFDITGRSMKISEEIFRAENISIFTKIQTEQSKYQAIIGAMMVELDGENMTIPKAADRLQWTDRNQREEAYRAIQTRRLQDKKALDAIFDQLVAWRDEVAKNAGFANFRDYQFAAYNRFDYTSADCFTMHEAVKEAVMPIINQMALERKEALNLNQLRPWDYKVDTEGKEPLKPFVDGEDLLNKSIACFDKIDVQLGNYLRIMREMKHFDVESRKGKAPGGYNYPLEEVGVPFIFMNATSSLRDLVTMVHEGGHASHSFLTRDLAIASFKNPPMEVAELASMAMELISMEHWNVFFENPEDLKRAKIQHLESIIEGLPWIVCVDKFQHWIYENPTHTHAQRDEAWVKTVNQFSDTICDWEGLNKFKEKGWHRQLHIFEVPFYYIEYGMAQLGAISVWKNYKENPKKGIEAYKKALTLGYTASISEIYATAGIKFDFSKGYISELMQFVENELNGLKK